MQIVWANNVPVTPDNPQNRPLHGYNTVPMKTIHVFMDYPRVHCFQKYVLLNFWNYSTLTCRNLRGQYLNIWACCFVVILAEFLCRDRLKLSNTRPHHRGKSSLKWNMLDVVFKQLGNKSICTNSSLYIIHVVCNNKEFFVCYLSLAVVLF